MAHPQIWEVILSGGDPLVVSARRLKDVVASLAAIDHVKVIRVHTRVPAVAPERISTALVRALRAPGKATFVVLHVNHPRELTKEARAACARFIDAGIPMLSQSVLLRGVNDDVETLGALMRSLIACRIKPYYLHHADLAPGTAHLRTTIAEGQALMRGLRGRYSGLCQPAYVLDIPDGHGKSPIGPNYLTEGGTLIEDFSGAAARISATHLMMRKLSSDNIFQASYARKYEAKLPPAGAREEYRRLETVTAAVARPVVAHASFVDVFRPIRRKQPAATLRTNIFIVSGKTCVRGLFCTVFSCLTPPEAAH